MNIPSIAMSEHPKVLPQSSRLLFRPFLPEDATHLVTLNNPDEVFKFTGDKPFKSLEEAQHFIATYPAYKNPNPYQVALGRWAVVDKNTQQFVGWCGLKWHAQEQVVDLGYRIKKEYWGLGYATQAAKACIHFAFNHLKLAKLVAHTHRGNLASQHVLKKCDFTFIKNFIYKDLPARLYELKNTQYSIREISSQQTYPVRHPVLRKGKSLSSCRFDNDDTQSTFHLGCYYENGLVGVATFLEQNNLSFTGDQIQLRGMAVLPNYRKRGLGQRLLHEGIFRLREKNKELLWFNAREVAVPFYTNLGFETYGDPFEIKDIGKHYLMYTSL